MEKYIGIVVITLVVIMTATYTHAHECCSAHTDLHGENHDAMLCDDYCCYDYNTSLSARINATLTCCDDITRHVSHTQRQEDCVDNWFKQHTWIFILSGIVILIIVIVVCCCYCCCCRRSGQSGETTGLRIRRTGGSGRHGASRPFKPYNQ